MEYKNFQFKIDDLIENEEFLNIKGYAAFFGNEDSYGDIIQKGAFYDDIQLFNRKEKILALLWMHNISDFPVGKIKNLAEDENGLLLDAFVFKHEKSDNSLIYSIKNGVVNEFSIGYEAVEKEMVGKNRILKKINLKEISLITANFAANPKAKLISFKSIRDAEMLLKEKGFSVKESKIFISEMKNLLQHQTCDELDEVGFCEEDLKTIFNSLCNLKDSFKK